MKKIYLFIALIICLNINLSASDIKEKLTETVRGKVIDSYTQLPLPGANIKVIGSDPIIGTATDGNGNFVIENIPIGRVSLSISYMGYQTKIIDNLVVVTKKETNVTIELTEQAVSMEEITVKARSRKNESSNKMAPVSARSFVVEETSLYAGSIGDPARMAGNFAGILAVDDTRNDIVIRGNSPYGLLWRIDGFDMPNPNHFSTPDSKGGPMSMLNNNNLSNSDFFTGAFPAEYGNALSGVFDLNLRNGNTYKCEHVAQIATSGIELGTEGPIGKNNSASYIVNYRYSSAEAFDVIGLYDENTIPKYQDISFKINIPNTKIGYIQLFGIGGLNGIEIDSRKQDSTEWTYGLLNSVMRMDNKMGIVGLTHTYYFNENTRIITKLSLQGVQNGMDIDSVFSETSSELSSELLSIDSKSTYEILLKSRINSKNTLSLGAKFEAGKLNYMGKVYSFDGSIPDFELDVNENINTMSAFIQYQHKFNNSLSMNLGARYYRLLVNNTYSIDPKASIKYQFFGNQNLSFGYGIYSQKQNNDIYFIESYVGNGNYIRTQENLDLTKSQHFVLGYNNLLSKNLNLKLEAYYQNIWDAPVTANQPQYSILNSGGTYQEDTQDNLVNKGTGTNYGLELTFEKYLHKSYYFLFTGSLFDSKYKGYDNIERNTAFNGNYALNALFGYDYKINEKHSLGINVRSVYAGGKRKLPIDLDASSVSADTEYDWDNAYKDRHPDYTRFDVKISFKTFKKKYSDEIAIDIINIANNTSNVINQYYDHRTNTIETDYQYGRQIIFMWRIYF